MRNEWMRLIDESSVSDHHQTCSPSAATLIHEQRIRSLVGRLAFCVISIVLCPCVHPQRLYNLSPRDLWTTFSLTAAFWLVSSSLCCRYASDSMNNCYTMMPLYLRTRRLSSSQLWFLIWGEFVYFPLARVALRQFSTSEENAWSPPPHVLFLFV